MKSGDIIFAAIVIALFFGGFGYMFGNSNGIDEGWDLGYDECQMAAPKPVRLNCFERVVRYDRYIDYESNIVTQGYFYNTSWERTQCVEFEQDKYESLGLPDYRDVLVGEGVA